MLSLLSTVTAPHEVTGLDQFIDIISKPDNMPVAGALLLVVFFSWVSMRQALHNDRLIREGKKDKIIEDMQR